MENAYFVEHTGRSSVAATFTFPLHVPPFPVVLNNPLQNITIHYLKNYWLFVFLLRLVVPLLVGWPLLISSLLLIHLVVPL